MFDWMGGWGSAARPRCARPEYDMADENAGLASATRVACADGWREIGTIVAGDEVLTFDAGLQKVTSVEHRPLWPAAENCPRSAWPLEVPRGALGNHCRFLLIPGQTVMIESDAAEEIHGDPFALVPAVALENQRGICRVPPRSLGHATLLRFETDQVIFAESGAMFLCPQARDILDSACETGSAPDYRVLSLDEAREIVSGMDRPVAEPRASRPFWSIMVGAA